MIKRLLEDSNRSIFVGRNGSIELAAMLSVNPMDPDVMERHTGIWPSSSLHEWRLAYLKANRSCDVIAAGWFAPLATQELELLRKINPNVGIVPLRALEPYYESDPSQRWTHCLRGKRVAVVNSFVDTMIKQLPKREQIWGEHFDSLLPDANYLFYKTGFTPKMSGANRKTRWATHVTDWRSAANDIVESVVKYRADIVLIGCGGLSMIVANELKAHNVSTVVMGGAIQVLFGIKGHRWENHPIISKFWNDSWVYPSADECPELCNTVENGCYK